jgi:hypothetical protein
MFKYLILPIFFLAGVMFIIPWVSAGYEQVAEISLTGIQLVTGYEVSASGITGLGSNSIRVAPDPIAISVLGIVLLGCLAFFIKGKTGSIMCALLGFLGAGLMVVLMMGLDSNPGALALNLVEIADIEFLAGFWLTLAAMALAGLVAVIDLSLVKKPAVDQAQYIPSREVDDYQQAYPPVGYAPERSAPRLVNPAQTGSAPAADVCHLLPQMRGKNYPGNGLLPPLWVKLIRLP